VPIRTQLLLGTAIAMVSGYCGYQLGDAEPPLSEEPPSPDRPVAHRSSKIQQFDSKKFRAALDAEEKPLTRFQLALRKLDAWINQDPIDALNWLASQAPSARRNEVIRMALLQVSETDAKTAANWAEAQLDDSEFNNAIIAIAAIWAQQNGKEAALHFLTKPDSAERAAAAEQIFFTWATHQAAAALDFLNTSSGWADLTPTLRRAALAGWAKTEPEAATTASLALSRTHQDPAQFANTLANWATLDLDASSTWLLSHLDPSPERSLAATELANIYAQQAPETGISWLENLKPGDERNAAASALAIGWAPYDPVKAANWAAIHSNYTLSNEAVSQIAYQFVMRDPSAFETWRATLPPGPFKNQVEECVPETAE
jgi:hypothetical protein